MAGTYDIGTDQKVGDQKLGGKGLVGMDAADSRGTQHNGIGFFPVHPPLHIGLSRQVEMLAVNGFSRSRCPTAYTASPAGSDSSLIHPARRRASITMASASSRVTSNPSK